MNTSEIRKGKRALSMDQVSKTKTTSSKKSSSKNGSSPKELLANLISNISIVKGLLATLQLRHKSDWIKKLAKTDPEHLRILLLEMMDDICIAEESLTILSSQLEKKYYGICLL